VVIMVPTAQICISGPAAVRSVTGEEVQAEQLGGAEVHASRSGVAHVTSVLDL
jgi:acetyl-CoA carboxylase carboxyltransferase component